MCERDFLFFSSLPTSPPRITFIRIYPGNIDTRHHGQGKAIQHGHGTARHRATRQHGKGRKCMHDDIGPKTKSCSSWITVALAISVQSAVVLDTPGTYQDHTITSNKQHLHTSLLDLDLISTLRKVVESWTYSGRLRLSVFADFYRMYRLFCSPKDQVHVSIIGLSVSEV